MWQKAGSGNKEKPKGLVLGTKVFSAEQVCVLVRPKPCSARQKHPAGLNNDKHEIHMKTIKNRNVNGRPTKKPSEKKTYKKTEKMATEDYYSLKAKAGLAGINGSEFIHQ